MIKINSSAEFSKEVEKIVSENEDLSYLDAVMVNVERNKVEVESVLSLLTPNLKAKLENEANDLNLLKVKSPTLKKFVEDD